MAIREFWIQIENQHWDMNPNNINRMTGESVDDEHRVRVIQSSNETGVTREVWMNEPVAGYRLDGGALILRRYTENWGEPDDRKVNPWDLNEPDPTDSGTMGTIPGATIECNVGDKVIVHFRNMDLRTRDRDNTRDLTLEETTHSLHPHGIVFAPEYAGAYPLSPPDLTQPIGVTEVGVDEATVWSSIGVYEHKMGDRVPRHGTFTYRWDTRGWPATAGVWSYHDHSIFDHEALRMGAVGFLVIHNPDDEDDVLEQDLPRGEPNGRVTRWCHAPPAHSGVTIAGEALRPVSPSILDEIKADSRIDTFNKKTEKEVGTPQPDFDRIFMFEGNPVEVNVADTLVGVFLRCYVNPPQKALYLQLYHDMPREENPFAMAINGRHWLGNTPTVVGGLDTMMGFGLLAMNYSAFHTFHLHGHRWVLPGPSGDKVGGESPPPGTGVQTSPLNQAVSQFEDTKVFGPANSFSFTIRQGSFMGPPPGGGAKGEWHMHCHVLAHAEPMMGSLLIVEEGDIATTLPRGVMPGAEDSSMAH